VVANGHLSAFEIKSAADTLARLQGQLKAYRENFEATTVVCASKHLDAVRELAPKAAGILVVSSEGSFTRIRDARLGKVDKKAWLRYLPVKELRKLLQNQKVRASHLTDRRSLSSECMKLSHGVIRAYTLDYIKRRDERNAEIRETALKRKMARQASLADVRLPTKNWLAAYASLGVLEPIPRKVA